MNINKQTLFLFNRIKLREEGVYLFDLKTLSTLRFSNLKNAVDFCDHFNETQCKEELFKYAKHGCKCTTSIMYISTDQETERHTAIQLDSAIISTLSSERLLQYVKNNEVNNLELGIDKSKIRVKWLIEPTPNGFTDYIDRQYKEFQQSSKLLGKEVSFNYTIIGEYVILTRFNRTSDRNNNRIVPSFVTSLSEYLFPEPLHSLTLVDGVKFIGSNMCCYDENTKLIGGRDLEYIGHLSLNNNKTIIVNNKRT